MARHPILKGLGILFVLILIIFVGVFFYAYLTGGDSKVWRSSPATVLESCRSKARSTIRVR